MTDPAPAVVPGPPPRQRPSGCLLLLLCIASAVLLVFGGCCIILSSELSKNLDDWLTLGIPSLVIFAAGALCTRSAWRMYRRWQAAKPKD